MSQVLTFTSKSCNSKGRFTLYHRNSLSKFLDCQHNYVGYRNTGIFPFDPSLPVSPPVIEKQNKERNATRKERKENRSVKILFQEKENDFNKLKESVEPKKKKSTFVPPYRATITEDSYYEQKKSMEKEKKGKQKKLEVKTKSCKRNASIFTK